MECKLELSVFRFDATTDFLPYYKKHIVKIDLSKNVNDLFALIAEQDGQFGYPKGTYAALKINGKALYATTSLEEIVEHFGKVLTLEPLNTKRATKDIIINDEDFYRSFALISALIGTKEKRTFQKYLIYHYASSVLNLLEGYLGDALFAFAYDMIQKYPEKCNAILELIADEEHGIFHHVRLCNKIYPCAKEVEQKISALKNSIVKEMPHTNALVEKLSHRIDAL